MRAIDYRLMQQHINKSCGNKVRHTDVARAKVSIKSLVDRHMVKKGELHVYPCNYCEYFHVGHSRGNC